jgi:antitoxin component YwqK of YwqJK toxin-antitoxin module
MRKYLIILACLFFIACSKEIVITEEQLKQDLLYLKDDIKPFSGTCNILFTDTNLIKEHFKFKDGALHGVSCSYFKYGNLKWRGEYREGKMSEKWEFWDKKGNKFCETHFKDDLYHGPYTAWHANGKVKETGQYENNKKTGIWTVYNDSGKVISKYNY